MSPFLQIPESKWLARNELAFAIADGFPVSPGHALVITRREVATWADATRDEQLAVMDLVEVVRAQIQAERSPDGFNVGFNLSAEPQVRRSCTCMSTSSLAGTGMWTTRVAACAS